MLEVNISLNTFLREVETTISLSAVTSDEDAIKSAVPLDTAVALPSLSIVITDSSEDDHATFILSIRLLFLSNPRA